MGKLKIALMIVAIVVVVVIAGSLVYYYVFFRPGIEKAELKLQEQKFQQEQDRQTQESLDKALKEQEATQKQEKTQESIAKKQALEDCLTTADTWINTALLKVWDTYTQAWNDECAKRGLPYGSSLPTSVANKLEQDRNDVLAQAQREYELRREDCYKKYGN